MSTLGRSGLAVLLLVGAGCRSSREFESGVAGGVVGGIGCDICAVMLRLEVVVNDDAGAPVPGAEVWMLGPERPPLSYTRGWRFGTTDEQGRLSGLHCYMPSRQYQFWDPAEEPVVVRLLVFLEGYGSKRLVLTPPTQEVLASGGLIVAPPGPEGQTMPLKGRGDAESRAYLLQTQASLPRVVAHE